MGRKSGHQRRDNRLSGFRAKSPTMKAARQPIADLDLVIAANMCSYRADQRLLTAGPNAPKAVSAVASAFDERLRIREREWRRQEIDCRDDGRFIRHCAELRYIVECEDAQKETLCFDWLQEQRGEHDQLSFASICESRSRIGR
jgi:hypothetical protein